MLRLGMRHPQAPAWGGYKPPGCLQAQPSAAGFLFVPSSHQDREKEKGHFAVLRTAAWGWGSEVQAGASGGHSPAGGDTDPSCLPLPPTAPAEPSLCHLPFGGTPGQDAVPCTMEEAKFSPPRVALSRSMGAGWEPRPLCQSWGVWEPTSPITPAPAVMALRTTPLPPAPVPTP